MLNRKEFYDYMKEHVKEYLPPSYENAEVSIMQTTKNNDLELTALVIRREEEKAVPVIYLDSFYGSYRQGKESLDSCVGDVADMRIEYDVAEEVSDIQTIYDYSWIKDKLHVKLCDKELNEQRLKDCVYTEHGDFAAYYSIQAQIDAYMTGNIMVNQQLLDKWEVDVNQLHQDALKADLAREPLLCTLEDMMLQVISDSDEELPNFLTDDKDAGEYFEPAYCLTNDKKQDGAALILQEELMKQVGERVGSNFFVLPSSVHEVILIPDKGVQVLKDLSAMVHEVNDTQVSPDERLSYKVQYYDRETGILENAEKREMRQALEKNGKIAKFSPKKGIHTKLDQAKFECKAETVAEKKEIGRTKDNVL